MTTVGDKAKVISSNGFHSRKYVGKNGYVIKKFNALDKCYFLLRFASNLSGNEEGLYSIDELDWSNN